MEASSLITSSHTRESVRRRRVASFTRFLPSKILHERTVVPYICFPRRLGVSLLSALSAEQSTIGLCVRDAVGWSMGRVDVNCDECRWDDILASSLLFPLVPFLLHFYFVPSYFFSRAWGVRGWMGRNVPAGQFETCLDNQN